MRAHGVRERAVGNLDRDEVAWPQRVDVGKWRRIRRSVASDVDQLALAREGVLAVDVVGEQVTIVADRSIRHSRQA